ncbi:MAG: hypothetical protein CR991_01565 [Proteobacteria bacterium]|nr:MAG: hypothetical protein CR991_01565 [Pseudomonadota bacterium]
MQKNFILLAASLLGMLAVILGAFGAHGLEKLLEEPMQQRFHTGVEYQFYHTSALLALGLLYLHDPNKWLRYAAYAFIFGIIVFSGSLYLYVLTANRNFGMITPVGGSSFILGWILMWIGVWHYKDSDCMRK